jgi:hypothetical protein
VTHDPGSTYHSSSHDDKARREALDTVRRVALAVSLPSRWCEHWITSGVVVAFGPAVNPPMLKQLRGMRKLESGSAKALPAKERTEGPSG